ncbi:MAG: ABC transporter ATP-binding protein [Rhodospirillaceae bacterium]|nr:ABC transporter ATP-binding protein [Rhodospirillaceae bacterium]
MSLAASGIGVSYGAVTVLSDVGFEARPGTITGLIGPNGTGKSTLLKTVAGLVPGQGTVSLHGQPPLPPRGRRAAIAYMPQDSGPASSLTVMEVVLLGRLASLALTVPADLRDRAAQTLARFGLLAFQGRTLGELSGGQRQLVYLAQSIFRAPAVLLLDEPTAALDLRHQLMVLDAVADHCRTQDVIVMAAMHDLSLAARYCGHLLCLSQGTIRAAGPPGDVLTPDRLRAVYGVRAEIARTPSGAIAVVPVAAD